MASVHDRPKDHGQTTGIVRGLKLFNVPCHQRESLAGSEQPRRRGNAENSHLSCRNALRENSRKDTPRPDLASVDVDVKGARGLSGHEYRTVKTRHHN